MNDDNDDDVGVFTIVGVSTLVGVTVPRKPAMPFANAPLGIGLKNIAAPTPAHPPITLPQMVDMPDDKDEVGDATLPMTHRLKTTVLPFVQTDEDDDEVDQATLRMTKPFAATTLPALNDEIDEIGQATRPMMRSSAADAMPFIGEQRKLPAPPPLMGPVVTPKRTKDTELPAEPEKLPVEAYPIERCAAIAARIALGTDDAYTILKAEGLREEQWPALDRHWLSEIHAEAGRGKKQLLAAYDAAYVGAIEEARGPIGTTDYAKLVIAAERGNTEETLREMGLPGGMMMRIRRVWLERLVKDRKTAAKVREAVRRVRDAG